MHWRYKSSPLSKIKSAIIQKILSGQATMQLLFIGVLVFVGYLVINAILNVMGEKAEREREREERLKKREEELQDREEWLKEREEELEAREEWKRRHFRE